MLVERELELVPVVGAQFGGPNLEHGLAEMLRDIDHFKLVIDISGTVDAPRWKIHSDLGPLLQERFQHAFQQVVNHHAQQLALEAQDQLGLQIQQWEQVLAARQSALTHQLGIGDNLLSTLSPPAVSRLQKPLDRLLNRF